MLEPLDNHMAWQEPIFVLVEWGRQLGSKRNNDLDHAEWISNLRCESKFWKGKTIMDLSISCRSQAPTWLRSGGKLEASIKTDVAKWQAKRASESESSRWIQIINKEIDMEGRWAKLKGMERKLPVCCLA